MRPDQTASTLWTTNWSCTTRQITPTTEACRLLTGLEKPAELLLGHRSGEVRLNFPSDIFQNPADFSDSKHNPGSVFQKLSEFQVWDRQDCPVGSDWTLCLKFSCRLCWKGTLRDVSQILSCNFVYLSWCKNYLLKLTTVFPVWKGERHLDIFTVLVAVNQPVALAEFHFPSNVSGPWTG